MSNPPEYSEKDPQASAPRESCCGRCLNFLQTDAGECICNYTFIVCAFFVFCLFIALNLFLSWVVGSYLWSLIYGKEKSRCFDFIRCTFWCY